MLYMLGNSIPAYGKNTKTIQPIVFVVEPGQTINFDLDSTSPNNIAMHDQHEWRYVHKFLCKQHEDDATKCSCSLTIKHEDHEPTMFSLFENNEESQPEIKAYVNVVKIEDENS